MTLLRTRARSQDGFGMIELLAAMMIMSVGILALFSMFQSSAVQIRRAAAMSTAAALADSEMERFRAVRYNTIGLAQADVAAADSVYRSESGGAFNSVSSPENATNSTVVVDKCPANPCTSSLPTKELTGADGRAYRVDTYITWMPVTNENGVAGRDVKLVTIVVREARTNVVRARVSSSFDELTGV